jgi:hypothetical protein
MLPATAAALVGAGVLSVLVYPLIAVTLHRSAPLTPADAGTSSVPDNPERRDQGDQSPQPLGLPGLALYSSWRRRWRGAVGTAACGQPSVTSCLTQNSYALTGQRARPIRFRRACAGHRPCRRVGLGVDADISTTSSAPSPGATPASSKTEAGTCDRTFPAARHGASSRAGITLGRVMAPCDGSNRI